MKLNESLALRMNQWLEVVADGKGDTVLVPMASLAGGFVNLAIRLDLNVFFHLYCDDWNAIVALFALKRSLCSVEAEAILDAYQVDFDDEAECLKVQALSNMTDVSRAACRMAQCVVALRSAAWMLTDWKPTK